MVDPGRAAAHVDPLSVIEHSHGDASYTLMI
jgi:hypothetical protein